MTQFDPSLSPFTAFRMEYVGTIADKRIVSLLDMLKIESWPLFAALTHISVTIGQYKALMQLSAHSNQFVVHSNLTQRSQLLAAIRDFGTSCNDHGLSTTARLANYAYDQCSGILASQAPLNAHVIQDLLPIIQGLPSSFVAEAESRKFFSMSSGADQYHKSADDLYGQHVVDAFPNASFDIEEAGKCQAFGLWTASVMHTMRVLEIGLQSLANHLKVEHGENWNQTLNQIEAKLREVRKKVDGAEAEEWAAEAGTHLRFIKNAWRNQTMHPKSTYDEVRAKEIFDNARSFMTHLADKIGAEV